MTSIPLTWGASTDDVGVTGYRIDKAGTQVGTATQTGYTVTGLTCGTAYALTVRAYDAAGNLSAPASTTASTAAVRHDAPVLPARAQRRRGDEDLGPAHVGAVERRRRRDRLPGREGRRDRRARRRRPRSP